jgi:hypothetical protein
MNRQKKILLFLFGLFVLALCYSYWMMPVQQRVSLEVQSGSAARVQRDTALPQKNRLRIDLLDKEPTRYKGASRDIFNFAVTRTKPVKKPLPKPAVTPAPTKPVQPKPTPVLNQVVRQQLARFTFLGSLIKDEVITIFLSRGEDLFLVQEGDRFGDANQFTALTISPDKLSISQAGDSRTIDIVLIEKEPLIPSMQQVKSVNMPPVTVQNPAPVKPKNPPANTPRWKRPAGSGTR